MEEFLQKIERIDLLGERVYRQLRSYLWSGNVRWGEMLRESVLAKRLGVSRTPVREALMRLASEGFLEARERGFAVPALDEEEIEEIYHLRVLLETDAVRIAAAAVKQSPARLAPVRRAIAQADKAVKDGDGEMFISANLAFREAWLGLVRNRRLANAVELYAGLVRSLQILSLGNGPRQVVVLEEMKHLFADLEQGNPDAAAQTMLRYLDIARMAMLESLPAIARHNAS
jgi:DNA-binding GntR family transcriptional regulator